MKKKPAIVLTVCLLAMFLWVILAVLLTGGREVSEMSGRDYWVLAGAGVLELITVTILGKTASAMDKGGTPVQKTTHAAKARFLWNLVMIPAAMCISVGMRLLGIVLRTGHEGAEQIAWRGEIGCILLTAGVLAANFWGVYLYQRRFRQMDIQQRQQFVLSHREQAEQAAAQKLCTLRHIRRATNGYALVLLTMGLVLGLCSGCTGSTVAILISVFLIQLSFQQLPLCAAKAVLQDMRDILPEQDTPRLYQIAKEAAQETGWTGPVLLLARADNNVSISLVGKTAVVGLGAVILALLTEEELYAMLLHEFSHISGSNREEIRAGSYRDFLCQGRHPNMLSMFNQPFYNFSDLMYAMNYELYSYAASITAEQAADSAMARMPEAAAASLLKTKYLDLFLWEQEGDDTPAAYESVVEDLLRRQLAAFHQAFPTRKTDWEKLTKQEMEARSASHPTVWSRIQALGLEGFPVLSFPVDGEYLQEQLKVLEDMDARIAEFTQMNFEEDHRTQYLEPKQKVEQWQSAGSPVVAEEYADIVDALHMLGRSSEAIALCNRAIEALQPPAAAYAYFIRGSWRLRRYDAGGLQDLYTAIEMNNNAIDSALELIGTYCTLTGMQQELDTYREKALELMQRQEDQYSEIGQLTKKDHLGTEQLPEGMLEEILAHIRDDSIDKIYLVRKTITDSFFTSAFVIRFRSDADQEVQEQVMHRIFRYLDTCSDWQFSLFDYRNVPKGLVERVPDSCVYQRENEMIG